MKLSVGIVGMPNVGKSTLFHNLTKAKVNIANYPFCTIDPNVGIVVVPDKRLDELAKLSNSKKKIPAVVEFYDIAGLVRGAYKGEGLGNQFLAHIREVNAIVQVLRCFDDSETIHVEESINPLRDLELINAELAFKDLETIERVLKTAENNARTGDRDQKKYAEDLKIIKQALEDFKPISIEPYDAFIENSKIKELNLLMAKKQIYFLNGAKANVSEKLARKIKELGANYIIADLAQSPDIKKLIEGAYKILNLISFFTTGEEETRAWTVRKDSKARDAAAAIHTDFKDKFIRADIIDWQKLIDIGGWNKAREKGLIRSEGKDYVVKDGDVIIIKHGP